MLIPSAWYTIDGHPGQPPVGLFVVLQGTDPPGRAPFLFNRGSHELVSGAATCSRYLTFGDPGATQITEEHAARVLESMGGSMAAVRVQIAAIGQRIQYPEKPTAT